MIAVHHLFDGSDDQRLDAKWLKLRYPALPFLSRKISLILISLKRPSPIPYENYDVTFSMHIQICIYMYELF